MLTVSDDIKALFMKDYRQVARITVTKPGTVGQRFITEADIMQGGLVIDRYCTLNGKLDVGTFVASQLTLKLNNLNGKFNSWAFADRELFVEIGIKKWDAYEWENAQITYIPMGVFVVNKPVQKTGGILRITALDRAVYTDKMINASLPSTVTTWGTLLAYICTACGITCADGVSSLPKYDQAIDRTLLTKNVSYRTLVQWFAFNNGVNAYFDNEGYLAFKYFRNTGGLIQPELKLTTGEYFSYVVDKSQTYIMGGMQCRFSNGDALYLIEWGYPAVPGYYDGQTWIISESEALNAEAVIMDFNLISVEGIYYVCELSDCPFIKTDGTVLPYLVKGIKAFPSSVRTKSVPWIELMDNVKVNNDIVPVTHITFTMNGATEITCDIDAQTLIQEGVYCSTPPGIVI